MVGSNISSSAFGEGSSSFQRMRVYGRPFSIYPPVKMNYCLFRSIQTKAPNTGFALSTGVVNNPLIPPRFWNSMLDRYATKNFRVAVLITPTNQSPCLHNSAADNDAKYEHAQTILSVLSHGITSSFSTFLP